jgi:hypothetical protein
VCYRGKGSCGPSRMVVEFASAAVCITSCRRTFFLQTHRVKFMIRDRGSNFTAAFDAVLAGAGIRAVPCNVQTPRMNSIAECGCGGCRREFLDRTLIWNQAHLAPNPARVRDPPQSAPAAPVTGVRCAAETATRTGRS